MSPRSQPEPAETPSTLLPAFPQGPLQPPSPPPCPPVIPPKPPRLLPEFDDSDYDDVPEEGPGAPASVMTKEEPLPSRVPRAVRVASLLSEGEELSGDDSEDDDDHAYEGIPNGGWPTSGLNPPLRSLIPDLPLHPMDELPGVPPPSHLSSRLAGWTRTHHRGLISIRSDG